MPHKKKNNTFDILNENGQLLPIFSNEEALNEESLSVYSLKEEKEYTIKVLCNYSSNNSAMKFTNYINTDTDTIYESRIRRTIDLNGKKMTEDSLPFDKDGALHVSNKNSFSRLNTILSIYTGNELQEGDECAIYKCFFKNKASGLNIKESGNLLRIFYRLGYDYETIEIVLIDPNHLFASDSFDEKYEKYKNNDIDIKDIYNKYISLYK